MKAYGLARVLRDSFGLKTYVRAEDDDEAQSTIEVHSTLEPPRLRRLQEVAEENGWEVGFRVSFYEEVLELTERDAPEAENEGG